MVTLEPVRIRNEVRTKETQRTRRYWTSFCGVRTIGLAPGQFWEEFPIVVGFNHSWNSEPRRRCEHGVSQFFQAILAYNLSSIAGRDIESAVLVVEDSKIHDPHGEGCFAPAARIGRVGLPEWYRGFGKIPVDRLTEHRETILRNVAGTIRPDLRGPHWRLDITDWVQGWLHGTIRNHGIALAPWSTTTRNEDRSCVGTVRQAVIEVTLP